MSILILTSSQRGRQLPGIDPDRVVAIGYCFGGASVLELARFGADVDGFVSFHGGHGGLGTPTDQDYQHREKILRNLRDIARFRVQ